MANYQLYYIVFIGIINLSPGGLIEHK